MTVTNYQDYPQFPSSGGGGLSEPIVVTEVITSTLVDASVVRAAVVNSGSGGTPGSATVTGTTGTGTKFQAAVTITNSVASAVVNNAGDGSGTPGDVTITGTTGTGTKFQATGTVDGSGLLVGPLVVTVEGGYTVNPTTINESVTSNAGLVAATVDLTLAGGALSSVNSISVAGSYTVPPTDETNEPVTGGGLTGAVLSLDMLFAPAVVGSDPTKGLFFDGAGRPGLRGGGSVSTAITVTFPTETIDVDIPATGRAFRINAIGLKVDVSDFACLCVSYDGGATYLIDTEEFDTYLISLSTQNGATASEARFADSLVGFTSTIRAEYSAGGEAEFILNPGSVDEPFSIYGMGVVGGKSSGSWPVRTNFYASLNVDATVPPTLARVNAIRIVVYGNGDIDPPTGGTKITAGTITITEV